MTFHKLKYKNELIFVIDSCIINDLIVDKLLCEISSNKKIGLDMKNVKTISSLRFIELLLDNKFRMYNLKSEVLAYFAIIFKSGFLKSHMNYFDFKDSKRELIRRKLFVA